MKAQIESNKWIKYGNRKTKSLSHWRWSKIKYIFDMRLTERGIIIIEMHQAYKSQRCNCCGFVRKNARSGDVFICKNPKCSNYKIKVNADINSAKNNSLPLPVVPSWLRKRRLNRQGFFWSERGFFNQDGSELAVPDFTKRSN